MGAATTRFFTEGPGAFSMETFFKKYFWLVKAIGIAMVTALAANAATTQLGTSIIAGANGDAEGVPAAADGEEGGDGFDLGETLFGSRTSPANRRAPDKTKVAETIKDRNIFCPTCGPAEEIVEGGEEDPLDGQRASSLALKLMATMESTDNRFSLATIFDQDSQIAGVYGPGDTVRPQVLVMSIERGLVYLRNQNVVEYLELQDANSPKKRTAKPKAEEVEKPDPRGQRYIEGSEDSIDCPNENLCVVERAFVEKLMSNPALLAKQARVIPAMKDGETRGFKFYGIRKDSLPRLLGLKNGDMLMNVNGEELTSMDKAMSLYTKLRHASNLSITIERRGETISKEIQIK